jgi:hypothetical protein
MKEGFDREMDSLLRRRARGTAELRSWGDGAGDGSRVAHLDADELGAFAEGALPAAARMSAASHLADCERCRGVVVGLARVADAGAEVKPQTVIATESARPSAWRALVASLFAPRVMRFAVPVLALSLVGVVSYVALRSNNGGALQMAKEGRRPNDTLKEASAPAASTTSNVNADVAGLIDQNTNAVPRAEPPAGAQANAPKGHGGAEAQPAEAATDREDARPSTASPPPPPPATAPAEGPPALSKAAPKPVSTEEGEVAARADNKEKSENRDRDKSARASEPADETASNNVAMPQRRGQESRMNQVQMPDGGDARNQKRAADNNASGNYGGGGSPGASAPPKESDRERAGSRSETSGRARAPKQAEKKDDGDDTVRGGETRSAAGHRFRREGSAWVDVNYKPSMPSTGVRRGTEPFRALVADVPEVGRVAEAIGGEVVVVVGGRAYRIR